LDKVVLVPVGAADAALLEYLALMIGETLRCRTRLAPRPLSPDFAYDPVRRQHHSTALLSTLAETYRDGDSKILGVAEPDLFIPILTFVFGEAQLGGVASVISVARLKQSYYGLPDDPEIYYHRAEKESLHELGHTFGLIHCARYDCVMHFSNGIEEVDLKGDRFCPSCAERIGLPAEGNNE
jgi:archaemetzincin